MMKRKILAILVLAGAVSGAWAQALPSMYGVQFGEPLAMTECRRTQIGSTWSYDVVNTAKAPCFARVMIGGRPLETPLGDEVVSVMWPMLGAPDISREESTSVRLIGGVVHRMEIPTRGAAVQDRAFDQLLAKFGKPAQSRSIAMQNRMGASFQATVAEWELGGAFVTLLGMTTSIDRGQVVVETPQGREAHKAAMDRLLGNRPKM